MSSSFFLVISFSHPIVLKEHYCLFKRCILENKLKVARCLIDSVLKEDLEIIYSFIPLFIKYLLSAHCGLDAGDITGERSCFHGIDSQVTEDISA